MKSSGCESARGGYLRTILGLLFGRSCLCMDRYHQYTSEELQALIDRLPPPTIPTATDLSSSA